MVEKVGRNDPCPCGSGKKYKSCCIAKAKSSKRKFTAKVLSGPSAKKETQEFAPPFEEKMDLMERAFGKMIANNRFPSSQEKEKIERTEEDKES